MKIQDAIDAIVGGWDFGAEWGSVAYARAGKSKLRQIFRMTKACGKVLAMSVHYVRENDMSPRPPCDCYNCLFFDALREFAYAVGKPDMASSGGGLDEEISRIFSRLRRSPIEFFHS